jgi:hypothetical protein
VCHESDGLGRWVRSGVYHSLVTIATYMWAAAVYGFFRMGRQSTGLYARRWGNGKVGDAVQSRGETKMERTKSSRSQTRPIGTALDFSAPMSKRNIQVGGGERSGA